MRATLSTAVAAWLLLSTGASGQISAQECRGRAGAIGVSRVIEIDTASGPLFGMQYKESDLLQPGEIVLTFDDGPLRPYTQPVLDALTAHCTKATFFSVGRMAVSDPEMVKEIVRRGHTLGAHTWTHRNLKTLVPHRAIAEIELGFSAVRQAAGVPIAPFFRFPYLSDPKAMIAHLQGRGMAIFSIDADSYDYRTRNAGEVHSTILKQLAAKGKGIVLFHDIQPSTARALAALLGDLKARGFRVVHLVPKSSVETLSDYDAMAEQELAKKRAAGARPLAKRALVWPIAPAPGQSEPGVPATPEAAGTAAKPPARGSDRTRSLRNSSAQEPTEPRPDQTEPAETAERPVARQFDGDTWRVRVFSK